MAIKPFESLNSAYLIGHGKVFNGVNGIQDALKTLQVAELTPDGGQLKGIALNSNVTNLTDGYIAIEITELESLVNFGGVLLLRANETSKKVEYSADSGNTWTEMGAGEEFVLPDDVMLKSLYDVDASGRVDTAEKLGDGNVMATAAGVVQHIQWPHMEKIDYDPDNDNIVEAADVITDGTNTVTPAEVRTHLDSHPTEGDMYKSEYDTNGNGGIVDNAVNLNDGTYNTDAYTLWSHLNSHFEGIVKKMYSQTIPGYPMAEKSGISAQSDLDNGFSIVWIGELSNSMAGFFYQRKNDVDTVIVEFGINGSGNLTLTIQDNTITSSLAVPVGYEKVFEAGVVVDVPNNQAWFVLNTKSDAAQAITCTFPGGTETHSLSSINGGTACVAVTPDLLTGPSNAYRVPCGVSRLRMGSPSHFYGLLAEEYEDSSLIDWIMGGIDIPNNGNGSWQIRKFL